RNAGDAGRRTDGGGVGVLLQRAARPGAAHRVGRLPPTPQGKVMKTMARAFVALSTWSVLSGAASAQDLDPRITKLVAGVSAERLGAIRRQLQSFETRNTLSSTDSPTRGVGAAREWILKEMRSYSPKLQVSFDSYIVPPQGQRITRQVDLRNVMAVLPGRSPRRIYVSGHYDTVARPGGQHAPKARAPPDPDAPAPPPAAPIPPLANRA